MGKMNVDKGTVKIRMYDTEFGDCFLLGFPVENNDPKYMLIDFGMHHNTDGRDEKLADIAERIKDATGGKIDLLVVTHEHTDHMDGFKRANHVFRRIKVENLWLGWTENYDNPEVKKLDKVKKAYLKALNRIAAKLEDGKKELAGDIRGVLSFYGDDMPLSPAAGAYDPAKQEPKTNRQTMAWLKHHSRHVKYLYPGRKVRGCEGFENINFYIMGPPSPEDVSLLLKSSPSGGAGKETYLSDNEDDIFLNYVTGINQENRKREDLFAGKFILSDDSSHIKSMYEKKSGQWRKIEDVWTDVASELALKLDTHTNNTSLVVAIELGDQGKVLLFPGDAQVGNWLSWSHHRWKKGKKEITKDDLLARTVLYKAGHHGSHNATLKAEGVGKMVHPDLMCLIPVNRGLAEKHNWDIPYGPLLDELKRKCRQRVLRSDEPLLSEKPYNLSEKSWEIFTKSAKKPENEKYTELVIRK